MAEEAPPAPAEGDAPAPAPEEDDDPPFVLSEEQIEDVTNAYNKNKDEGGLLPVAELGTALRMLGHVLDKEDLDELSSECDVDGTGNIDLDTFIEVVRVKQKEAEDEVEIKEAFRILDRDNKGEIHTSVIKEILYQLEEGLTEEVIDDMIGDIDEDGSGWVDYDEFKELMLG